MLIERLKGQICLTLANGAVIDVNGVGYRVELPPSMICDLPENGSLIELWTYTYVREDALKLFGFRTYGERVAFELLIGLSGVGPKLALAILSTLEIEAIRAAVMQERADVFEVVPGIGKRLAEKILVDLKPKLDRLAAAVDGGGVYGSVTQGAQKSASAEFGSQQDHYVLNDVRSALENLGFKDKTITPTLKELAKVVSGLNFQEAMRKALKMLNAMPQKSEPSVEPAVSSSESASVDSQLF